MNRSIITAVDLKIAKVAKIRKVPACSAELEAYFNALDAAEYAGGSGSGSAAQILAQATSFLALCMDNTVSFIALIFILILFIMMFYRANELHLQA